MKRKKSARAASSATTCDNRKVVFVPSSGKMIIFESLAAAGHYLTQAGVHDKALI
jgi:hypothetical protein